MAKGDYRSRRQSKPTTHRGSRKRIRAIRMRESWSIEVWVFVAVMLFAGLVGVPWLIRHPSQHHHGDEWVSP